LRDYQKSRVYAWEDAVIDCRSCRHIKFEDAQRCVDGIFLCEQIVGSPVITKMPKQARRIRATGCREEIKFSEAGDKAWVLLHELSHTLTDDGHGPKFMGVYLKLLDKYEGMPLALTMYSLQQHKIDYDLSAQPCFKD
jgi:hypothetical protein